MSLFAIADLHLSLGCDKPMDVFPGWENYLQKLTENWNRQITPEDTVVIAGDISWALKLEDAEEDLRFLDSLPGKKVLIKGNHDLWWQTMAKNRSFLESRGIQTLEFLYNNAVRADNYAVCGTRGWTLEEAGDRKVMLREAGRLERSIQAAEALGGEPIVFLHYPPVCMDRECSELLEILRTHGIRRCYYGHLHGRAIAMAFQGTIYGTELQLISSDALQFSPVRI